MQVLLDTKKEYIEHLLDVFTIPMAKRIYKLYDTANSNMGSSIGTAVGSALNPERKIPQAYQGTLGLPDGTGVNGNITMSATSGQPQMGQPNLNPANTGGKGKGA